MRNNRLIITQLCQGGGKSPMINDSLFCKSIERAKEITSKRNQRYLIQATFKDKDGNEFKYQSKTRTFKEKV